MKNKYRLPKEYDLFNNQKFGAYALTYIPGIKLKFENGKLIEQDFKLFIFDDPYDYPVTIIDLPLRHKH